MAETDPFGALYALPLEEFTAARDALAAKLREQGDAKTATRIKKLRKPSLAAWAVNQVAHENKDRIQRLFDVRDEIEDAANAREMRAASEERRRLIASLVAAAERVLEDAGRGTGADTIQAITQTFHAGADESQREELLHGRLTREITPSGFGGLTPGFEPVEETDDRLEEKRAEAERLEREATEALAEVERAERDVAAAERALQKAQATAATVRRTAEQAAARAERARSELESA